MVTERMERMFTCRFGCSCRDALNCLFLHSHEELQLFKDERELRARKLTMRCGFCVRGECRFGPLCARSKRSAAVLAFADSDYGSGDVSAEDDNTDSAGGDNEGGEDDEGTDEGDGDDEGWCVQSSGRTSVAGDFCVAEPDHCGDEGRYAALWVEERKEDRQQSRSQHSMRVDAPDFRFSSARGGQAAEQESAAAQEEAALMAALAAAGEAAASASEVRKGADREAAAQKAAAVREVTSRAVAALEAVKAEIAAEYAAKAASDEAAYTERSRPHAWKWAEKRKVAAARETAEAVRVAIEAAEFRGDLAEFLAASGVSGSVDGAVSLHGGLPIDARLVGDGREKGAAVADEAADGAAAVNENSSSDIGGGNGDSARDSSRNDSSAGSSGAGRKDGSRTSRDDENSSSSGSNNSSSGSGGGRSSGGKRASSSKDEGVMSGNGL